MASAPEAKRQSQQLADVIRAEAAHREPAGAEAELNRLIGRPELLHRYLNQPHLPGDAAPSAMPAIPVLPQRRPGFTAPADVRFTADRPTPPPQRPPEPYQPTPDDRSAAIEGGSGEAAGTGKARSFRSLWQAWRAAMLRQG